MLEYWVISRRTVVELRSIDANSLEDARELAHSAIGHYLAEKEHEEVLSVTLIDQEE